MRHVASQRLASENRCAAPLTPSAMRLPIMQHGDDYPRQHGASPPSRVSSRCSTRARSALTPVILASSGASLDCRSWRSTRCRRAMTSRWPAHRPSSPRCRGSHRRSPRRRARPCRARCQRPRWRSPGRRDRSIPAPMRLMALQLTCFPTLGSIVSVTGCRASAKSAASLSQATEGVVPVANCRAGVPCTR